MAQQAGALIAAVLLAAALPALAADPPRTPWSQLSAQEQRVLGSVAPDWDHMSGIQQQRLRSSAQRYPQMRPIQRERFENRVHDWANMTPEQRNAARQTFQGFHQLPPEKQHELRERWLRERGSGGGPGHGGHGRPPGR